MGNRYGLQGIALCRSCLTLRAKIMKASPPLSALPSRLSVALFLAVGTVAAIAAPGDVEAAFTASANTIVRTTTIQTDGKILLGGDFSSVNGVTRSRIARLNADGTLDTRSEEHTSELQSL